MAGKNQIERIMYIDQQIRDLRYPNRAQIASYFEVTQKTISRDLEFLKDRLCAPIQFNRTKGGYQYSAPGFLLPRIFMNESEALELVLSQWMTCSVKGTPITDLARGAWRKLSEILPDKIEVDPNLFSQYLITIDRSVKIDPAIWHSLFKGARARTMVQISHYNPATRLHTLRTVHPYRLVHHRSAWYMIGWDEKAQDIRVFGISRIQEATLLPGQHFPKPDFDPDDYIDTQLGVFRGGKWFAATIRAAPCVADIVLEHLPGRDASITRHNDGSITARIHTNQREELIHWLMPWQQNIELLEPEDLRIQIAQGISAMAELYKGDRVS